MSVVDLLNQSLGFIVGILTSWVFLYLIQFLKPKLNISPIIVYDPEKNKLNIKVINGGRRQIIDIETSTFISERKPLGAGFSADLVQELEIISPTLLALNPKKKVPVAWNIVSGRDFFIKNGMEALMVLHEKHEGERRIVFRIAATHSLSGVRQAQQVTYQLSDVRVGKFSYGLKLVEQEDAPSIVQLIEESKAKQANP